uniref:Putative ovule protein n=1 Tax=Solanum chacoense TaxID=4108 RepID=A0A0V0GUH8_SOLCH
MERNHLALLPKLLRDNSFISCILFYFYNFGNGQGKSQSREHHQSSHNQTGREECSDQWGSKRVWVEGIRKLAAAPRLDIEIFLGVHLSNIKEFTPFHFQVYS